MLQPIRVSILQFIYQLRPFSLKGDLKEPLLTEIPGKISCLIPYSRKELLPNLLEDLAQQDFPAHRFEIILISSNPKDAWDKNTLTPPNTEFRIGYLRNLGLSKVQGELILFLDDDTRIFQKDFLSRAWNIFSSNKYDIIIPHGHPLFCYRQGKASHLKPFVFATRSCLIRRRALEEINGFRHLYCFDDTELRIRLELKNKSTCCSKELNFYHPPYHPRDLQKPLANATTILYLRKFYPFYVWILIYLNQFSLILEKNRSWHALGLLLALFIRQEKYALATSDSIDRLGEQLRTAWRLGLLKLLYRIFPFSLKGSLQSLPPRQKGVISCLIPSYRPNDLTNLLEDLSLQDLNHSKIDIVIINDGGAKEAEMIIQKYKNTLPITYYSHPIPNCTLGFLRNQSLSLSVGEHILFLDDDTRLFQKNFLTKALEIFENEHHDVIIPQGKALYSIRSNRYGYLPRYSFATRCCLYSSALLEKIGGFQDKLIAYEDFDLRIRASLKTDKIFNSEELSYNHAPCYTPNLNKALCLGQSLISFFYFYPPLIWAFFYLNGLRFLPYGLIPTCYAQERFKLSLGLLLAPFHPKVFFK